MNKFTQAVGVLETIEQSGYEAYFVGGCVRDYLLKKDINDVDIATSATPEEVMKIFPKYVPIGLDHGTVLVFHKEESYEITTFRTESDYQDFRRPSSVIFVRSLEEDLNRRDFTMNAIAMDKEFQISDPFEGQADIVNQQIKCVGNPKERFTEDALRIMRALRFKSQLGFLIEEQTKDGMKQNAHLLKHIAIERITTEFEKMLLGKEIHSVWKELSNLQVQKYLPLSKNAQEHLYWLSEIDWGILDGIEERWAALFIKCQETDVQLAMSKWKVSNQRKRTVKKFTDLFHGFTQSEISAYDIYKFGLEDIESLIRIKSSLQNTNPDHDLSHARVLHEELVIHSRNDLLVNGHILLNFFEGKKPGPWIEELLQMIEKQVVNRTLHNNIDDIKGWVLNCYQM